GEEGEPTDRGTGEGRTTRHPLWVIDATRRERPENEKHDPSGEDRERKRTRRRRVVAPTSAPSMGRATRRNTRSKDPAGATSARRVSHYRQELLLVDPYRTNGPREGLGILAPGRLFDLLEE